MKLRVKFFFAACLLFNLILRYPKSRLERGSDSFGNHIISQAIVNQGYDARFMNVLSFFGLFPGSTAMGGAFVLSGNSIITGLSIHESIFVLPIFYSILGFLSFFLFTRKFTQNNEISLFSALIYSTSRDYLALTGFTYSYRSLYLSVLPVLLFIIFYLLKDYTNKKINKTSFKLFLLSVVIILGLASIHRLVFMNGLLFFSILLFLLFYNYNHIFQAIFRNYSVSTRLLVNTFIFISLYVLSIYGYSIYSGTSEQSLEEGKKFINNDFVFFTVLNMGLMYSISFGILLPLSLFGYFSLFYRNDKIGLFLIILLLFYSLIWTDLTYGFLVILPILTLLVSLGIEYFVFKLKKYNISNSQIYAGLVVIIFFSQTLPEFVVVTESEYDNVGEDVNYQRSQEYIMAYDAGMYLSHNDGSIPVITNKLSSTRVTAHSGNPSYPHTETLENAEYYKYETVNFRDFLSGNLDHLYYVYDSVLVRSIRHDVFLSDNSWDSPSISNNLDQIYSGNGTYMLIVYSEAPTTLLDDSGNWVEPNFFVTATNENYKSYDNGFHQFYRLEFL